MTSDNEIIEKYANEMPVELRRAMKALSGNTGLAVFLVLFKYGELPFSEIRKELEIPTELSSQLTYHIKKLQKAGLIKNEYVKMKNTNRYSIYDITEFGEKLVNNLMNTIKVKKSEPSYLEIGKTFMVANSVTDSHDQYLDNTFLPIINKVGRSKVKLLAHEYVNMKINLCPIYDIKFGEEDFLSNLMNTIKAEKRAPSDLESKKTFTPVSRVTDGHDQNTGVQVGNFLNRTISSAQA